MRIAILDAWSGVAGDMWVGAMLDAGAPMEPLVDAVRSLKLPGVSIRCEPVMRASLRGAHFCVDVAGTSSEQTAAASVKPHAPGELSKHGAHVHRRLSDIECIIGKAELPDKVRHQCTEVYRSIAQVEAAAHGTTIDHVHFHEVGAEDTIVDVVCACLATHLLGIERLYANGIAVGSGTVRSAHGILPVPAPATAALLRGIPHKSGGLEGERTTPTGAALLQVLAAGFDQSVAMVTDAIGYGAGTRDDSEVPNLLRVTVGDSVVASSETELWEMQCQLDTATGEQVGWLLDALLQHGAVDAFATPVTMKKGRPGLLLTVLCDQARHAAISDLLLEESSSLGLRQHRVHRRVLERWQEQRQTDFGVVLFKVARLPSGQVVARPEDDELKRLSAEHSLGRRELLRRLLRETRS